jgi:hypothetical protein
MISFCAQETFDKSTSMLVQEMYVAAKAAIDNIHVDKARSFNVARFSAASVLLAIVKLSTAFTLTWQLLSWALRL